ncbi:MAG: sugar ABC transporter permease [Oscillospiraceae bacterium]|nr:sugar ABC transporter permease [Oscillospiraceae bacterium]
MKPATQIKRKRSVNTGILFLLPWLTGFVVFKLFPFLSSLFYSFTDFNLFQGITKYGLMNYHKIFTDSVTCRSLLTTIRFALTEVPLRLVAALLTACLLTKKLRCIKVFRVIYYIPSILGSSVAVSVLWKAFFRDDGAVNTLLSVFGIHNIAWLSNPAYTLYMICLMKVWQFGSSMVVFMAALKSVDTQLYDAARIDGASKIKCFSSITLPMISPAVFYNLVIQLCLAFQEFNSVYIITHGGPRQSTNLFSLLIYNNAFVSYDIGMASAMSWVIFIFTAFATLLTFKSQKYWVFYNDEENRR